MVLKLYVGKGTKYHPSFEYSTPETVWGHYGLTKERAENESGMNLKCLIVFYAETNHQ